MTGSDSSRVWVHTEYPLPCPRVTIGTKEGFLHFEILGISQRQNASGDDETE